MEFSGRFNQGDPWAVGTGAKDVLGPTAAYFSVGAKGLSKKQVANVSKVLLKARSKLGPQTGEPNGVPPRLLAALLKEASDLEDPLAQEYLAGVVASSRSPDPADDLALTYMSIIVRLSVEQLHFHYALYWAFYQLFAGPGSAEVPLPGPAALRCFIPGANLARVFGHQRSAYPKALHELLAGLDREGLLAPDYVFWCKGPLKGQGDAAERPGLVATPSVRGAGLFLYAHGLGGAAPLSIFGPGLALRPSRDVILFTDACRLLDNRESP